LYCRALSVATIWDEYWIDNWIYWITHSYNYSVYTPTAHYTSLQHLPSLLAVSSLAACLPIPDSARTPRLTDARPEYSLFCILKTRSLQLTRLDCRFTVDSRLGNSARTPRLN
jgi:hypothetical protein